MPIIKKIFSSLVGWLATALIVALGILKWEKTKNKELKDKVANKEVDIKIKDFEATEANIKNEVQNEKMDIKPNSDIKL